MFTRAIGLPLKRTIVSPRRQLSSARIVSNVKMISNQIFNRPGGTFIKRVGILIGAYAIINVMFNAMLFGLSVNYINKIQHIPKSFKLQDRYKFFQSVISDDVLLKTKEAHEEYRELLEIFNNEYGTSGADTLTETDLADKNEEFISGYCDLLLRYALTCNDQLELETFINKAFNIIDKYQECGNLALQNQALRTIAGLQHDTNLKESYYQKALELVANIDDVKLKDSAIIPANTVMSDLMLQSVLDLVYFYTDNKLQMNKCLTILVSVLRSLEYDKFQIGQELHRNKSSFLQKQVLKLETETIPLIKSNISELLWFDHDYEQAIKWAQESSLESLINARESYNSARICKNGFKNLSKMYAKLGKLEESQLCLSRANEINLLVPMNGITQNIRLRDVILNHYFGYWGQILFP